MKITVQMMYVTLLFLEVIDICDIYIYIYILYIIIHIYIYTYKYVAAFK